MGHPYCLPHHTTSCDSFKSRFTPHSQNSLSSRHLNILTRRKSPPPPFCPALLSTFLSLSTARNPAQPADAKASYENPSAQRKLHKLKASFTASFPARSSSIIPGTKGNSTITFLIWSLRLRAHTHSPS